MTVLEVNALSKKFCRNLRRSLFYGVRDIGAELLGQRSRRRKVLRKDEFWALQDLSFSLQSGDSVGLIGANGSGKTTLLRILSGLIRPDAGEVRISGKVAPLLALGAGFNPVLTGRENIFINMSILGLTPDEIRRRFDEVVQFADIGHALEAPIQTYSSGMTARLGFACAVHTNPDIFLVDEVLSVGDIKFRVKCQNRLADLKKQGTTFIIVSHNPISLLSLCDRALYLSRGKLIAQGATPEVMERYEADLFPPTGGVSQKGSDAAGTPGAVILQEVRVLSAQGKMLETLTPGEPATLRLEVQAQRRVRELNVNVIVKDMQGESQNILFFQSEVDRGWIDLPAGRAAIDLHLPLCALKTGVYSVKLGITEGAYGTHLDSFESFLLRVKAADAMSQCSFFQPREWKVVSQ